MIRAALIVGVLVVGIVAATVAAGAFGWLGSVLVRRRRDPVPIVLRGVAAGILGAWIVAVGLAALTGAGVELPTAAAAAVAAAVALGAGAISAAGGC